MEWNLQMHLKLRLSVKANCKRIENGSLETQRLVMEVFQGCQKF